MHADQLYPIFNFQPPTFRPSPRLESPVPLEPSIRRLRKANRQPLIADLILEKVKSNNKWEQIPLPPYMSIFR